MRYYFIAGEPSGDLHGAKLAAAMREADPSASMRGFGGDGMAAAGVELVQHVRELAFMGFVEVAKNYGKIRKNFALARQDIAQWRPDLVVLVDYPGFNLRMAEFCKGLGLRVAYYISPTIWAWKEGRVEKVRRFVDQMYVILPFEVNVYAKHGVNVRYLGHPIMDEMAARRREALPRAEFLRRNQLPDKPIIALLPGSRRQELELIFPEMLALPRFYPDHQFVVAATSQLDPALYRSFLQGTDLPLVFDQTHQVLQHAEAALVKSGTATLETALLGVPEVVCYRMGAASYQLAKRLVKVRYIALANLIMDKEVIPELIQDRCTAPQMRHELDKILLDKHHRLRMVNDFGLLRMKLGEPGASGRVGQDMVRWLREQKGGQG